MEPKSRALWEGLKSVKNIMTSDDEWILQASGTSNWCCPMSWRAWIICDAWPFGEKKTPEILYCTVKHRNHKTTSLKEQTQQNKEQDSDLLRTRPKKANSDPGKMPNTHILAIQNPFSLQMKISNNRPMHSESAGHGTSQRTFHKQPKRRKQKRHFKTQIQCANKMHATIM